MPQARILLIDAYDSFTNNIVTLLRDTLPVTVETIKHDDARFVLNDDAFESFLNKFDAIVAGPGPGHPATIDDIGLISKLWTQQGGQIRPVLGICLGFQSLALTFGARVERLKKPRHGLVRQVTHCGHDIFSGLDELHATQYHSLHVRISGHSHVETEQSLWAPRRSCKQIVPLAWDVSDDSNGPILMAARHCHLPFWGVQYHPESICSTGGGELMRNWWMEACKWNACPATPPTSKLALAASALRPKVQRRNSDTASKPGNAVHWTALPLGHGVEVAGILEALRAKGDGTEPMLLESGTRHGKPVNSETGRYSIVGLPTRGSLQLRWSVAD